MKYSLIIPIYNERLVLPKLIKQLYEINLDIQIIIIDDGSNDGTGDLLRKHYNRFDILQNEKNLGKGASIRRGLNIASSKYIILMDGDLEIDIKSIPSLIRHYENSINNILLGIRWKPNHKLPIELNRIGNFIINGMFNILYKTNFTDVLCCLKIIDTEVLRSFNLESDGFSIEVEIMANISLQKLSYYEKEIPYSRRNTIQGKKLKMTDSFEIILKIFQNRFLI